MTKCYECGKSDLLRKTVPYKKYDILIGNFPAEVCEKCHEVFFESEVVGEIEKKVKEKNLWGLAAKSRIGTSGHAFDVKLGKKLIEFLKIHKGQEILIEPRTKKKFEVSIL